MLPLLVDKNKVLLPHFFYIKLGIMKQFVNALDKNETCFRYLLQKFPFLFESKVKDGVLDGPKNTKTNADPAFGSSMSHAELS